MVIGRPPSWKSQASPPSSSLTSCGARLRNPLGSHFSHRSGGSMMCESAETMSYCIGGLLWLTVVSLRNRGGDAASSAFRLRALCDLCASISLPSLSAGAGGEGGGGCKRCGG